MFRKFALVLGFLNLFIYFYFSGFLAVSAVSLKLDNTELQIKEPEDFIYFSREKMPTFYEFYKKNHEEKNNLLAFIAKPAQQKSKSKKSDNNFKSVYEKWCFVTVSEKFSNKSLSQENFDKFKILLEKKLKQESFGENQEILNSTKNYFSYTRVIDSDNKTKLVNINNYVFLKDKIICLSMFSRLDLNNNKFEQNMNEFKKFNSDWVSLVLENNK